MCQRRERVDGTKRQVGRRIAPALHLRIVRPLGYASPMSNQSPGPIVRRLQRRGDVIPGKRTVADSFRVGCFSSLVALEMRGAGAPR